MTTAKQVKEMEHLANIARVLEAIAALTVKEVAQPLADVLVERARDYLDAEEDD